jgi:hypothetical protein
MRIVVLVLAVGYLLWGVFGFFVPGNAGSTHAGPFSTHQPHYTLLIFSVSPLLNIMHTLVGALGLLAARSLGGATLYGTVAAMWFTAVSAYELLVVTIGTGDRLNVNWADVTVHLATVVVGAALAFAGTRLRKRIVVARERSLMPSSGRARLHGG